MTSQVNVLVVDDEPVVNAAVRLVLEHEGMAVTTVPDAETALAHPDIDRFQLVICDLMLPGLSGLEVLAALRERRSTVPIVMITGYATPAHEDMVLAAGATAFLPKPFDESELVTLVRQVLAQAGNADEERNL